ncbi:MAG: response regulator [Acidobacteriota bacterium]
MFGARVHAHHRLPFKRLEGHARASMADYTILIIDYEPRSIQRLRAPLERAGYRVEVATDGKTGIQLFHKIEPAAVIIEAMLPKRHGFEVCHELKQTLHGSRCPVMIATSVYRGRRYRHQATHQYSCDAYLEKPLADEDLLSTIESGLLKYAAARDTAAVDPAATMEIDTTHLAAEASTKQRANGGPQSDEGDFDIVDRLDSLLSDDPSKSSPTRSNK